MRSVLIVALVALAIGGVKRNSATPYYPLILDILPQLFSASDYRNCCDSFLLRICAVIAVNMDHETHPFRELTGAHHCCSLISETQEWRITPRLLRRIPQVISASSRILCGDLLPCRILKLKLGSTLRSGQRSGRRLLPALPAKTVRRPPFLPPCQLPPQRLTASPRSAIRLGETDPRQSADCLW